MLPTISAAAVHWQGFLGSRQSQGISPKRLHVRSGRPVSLTAGLTPAGRPIAPELSYAAVDSMAAAVCHIASGDDPVTTAVPTAEWTISSSRPEMYLSSTPG